VQSARIAYFGLPLGALLLARDGHTIAYAGACRPAPGLRRLATHVAPGRTRVKPDPSGASALSELRRAAPDLIVSWFWTTKLPASVLAMAPAVGVHPSLLPRHRGPDPYFWTIDADDAETGVTAHLLDAEYDTGPILGQARIRVQPAWNAWELARALDRPSLRLLRDVVKAFAKGDAPAPVAQDERAATAAPAPTDEDLAIAWSWPAARIERRVRAAAPWPGAWTEIGQRMVTLVRIRPTTEFPRALEPAEATVRTDGIAVVRAGDSAVELHEGRDEDDATLGAADLAAIVASVRDARRM
jgi:methionyl-tRNA formyltransferase